MNKDEIKKNAPSGATHINQHGDYFMTENNIFKMWNPYNQEWFSTDMLSHDELKPL